MRRSEYQQRRQAHIFNEWRKTTAKQVDPWVNWDMALYNSQVRIMLLVKRHREISGLTEQDFARFTVAQAEEVVHRAHEVRLEVLIAYRQINRLYDELIKSKLAINQVLPQFMIGHAYREFTESRADKLYQIMAFCN